MGALWKAPFREKSYLTGKRVSLPASQSTAVMFTPYRDGFSWRHAKLSVIVHSVNIYPICDLPPYRSARRSFAPSQKSRLHSRSSKLFEVVKRHLPDVHAHAGDDELYISFKPGSSASELEAVTASQDCILDITDLDDGWQT